MMIILMSDFGLTDPYAAVMKGVIKQISPLCEIHDLTHFVPAQNIRAAAFLLSYSYNHFPKGTVFVCVIDPGVGGARKAIAIKTRQYYFIGPDNGLFSFLWQDQLIKAERSLPVTVHLDRPQYYYKQQPDSTFHGRDIFAPAAAHLEQGIAFENLGSPLDKIMTLPPPSIKKISASHYQIPLLHIDHFGNLIFSIDQKQFNRLTRVKKFKIIYRDDSFNKIENNYENRAPLILLFNSYGLLEIASPSANAALITNTEKTDNNYLEIMLS